MSCFHPLMAIPSGTNLETGKPRYVIRPYDERAWRDAVVHYQSCLDSVSGLLAPSLVPCGRCLGCRLDYSSQWAARCMLELGYHDSSWFLTLTYDDVHVPRSYVADSETGEAIEHLTLRYRDFQLFMKRLRKNSGQKLRYYMAAEYGSLTYRPHYHVIIFGLELDDLVVYQRSACGDMLYTSQFVQDCWSVREGSFSSCEGSTTTLTPLGKVVIGEVTWQSCAYVARYVTKKLMGPDAFFYDCNGMERPSTHMSTNPGIGYQYYEDHPDLFDYDFINISTPDGGKKFPPPKYFSRKLEQDNPRLLAEVKARRKERGEARMQAELARTDLDYMSYLAVKERALQERVRKLKREEV